VSVEKENFCHDGVGQRIITYTANIGLSAGLYIPTFITHPFIRNVNKMLRVSIYNVHTGMYVHMHMYNVHVRLVSIFGFR
jgi:hypothetical protein